MVSCFYCTSYIVFYDIQPQYADFGYSFHTGPYSNSEYEISGPSSAPCESFVYYTIPELAGVTSIKWIWPPEWTYSRGQGTRYLDLITVDYSGTVGARVYNTCGQGSSYDMHYTYVYGYCGGYNMAFPNPASNYVDIDINPEAIEMKVITTDSENDKLTKMYDNMGTLYYSSEFTKLPYRLKTNKFPEGNYVVQIIDGQNTSSILYSHIQSKKALRNNNLKWNLEEIITN